MKTDANQAGKNANWGVVAVTDSIRTALGTGLNSAPWQTLFIVVPSSHSQHDLISPHPKSCYTNPESQGAKGEPPVG